MAFFVKVTPANAWYWGAFAVREFARGVAARISKRPQREQCVLEYVKQHAKRGEADSVLQAMDAFARDERFLMNVGAEKGIILDEAVRRAGAKYVLELGGYCGYSAVRTARHLKSDSSKLISIEKSSEYADIARQIVNFAGFADRVQIMVGDAGDVIPHLDGPFDLVFIDHWKDRYLPDLLLIERHRLLHEGSMVVADNVGIFEGSVKKYLEHVRTDPHYETAHFDTHMEYEKHIPDAVEVSVYHDQDPKSDIAA